MSFMKTLPLLDGTRVIVIDEGLDVMHATALIAGWVNIWKEKNSDSCIDLLSFSDPKAWYDNEPEPLVSANVNLHDYFSICSTKSIDDLENINCILNSITLKHQNIVIVNCLSSLILYVGLGKALQFIDKLYKQVLQLICIYRRDFIQIKFPAIETFGTTYVKLEKFTGINSTNSIVYNAKVIQKKSNGSMICKTEIIRQNIESYQINAEEVVVPYLSKTESVKIETSFRIEMSAQEMNQRDKTPLPYTLNASNISRIFYQPEDIDDIDEEDPDDDLCI